MYVYIYIYVCMEGVPLKDSMQHSMRLLNIGVRTIMGSTLVLPTVLLLLGILWFIGSGNAGFWGSGLKVSGSGFIFESRGRGGGILESQILFGSQSCAHLPIFLNYKTLGSSEACTRQD